MNAPPPRVLCQGDLSVAVRWVGYAKKVARECYLQRIANKVYRLGAGLTIRVENAFPALSRVGGLSKVWIYASGGLHGFQFIYSGEIAEYRVTTTALEMQGSAVWVPLSRLRNENSGWALPNWEVSVPKATGSTLELLPGKTELDTEMQRIQKVENLVQVALIPEPVFFHYPDLTKPPVCQVANAWNATEGEIYHLGVFSDYPIGTLTDVGFDLYPTPIRGAKPKLRAPDSDWPDNCGMQTVVSAQYGKQRFLIMVDGSGTFHCWPDPYEGYADLTPEDSPYLSQSYKVTVPSEYVKTTTPTYPTWVHTFPEGFKRRDDDYPHPGNVSSEPRYVWRFSPDGKKVVGHLLNRDNETRMIKAMTYGNTISTPTDLMALQMDASSYDGGVVDWQNMTFDVPGWAEFSIDISINGTGLGDFDFGLTLLRNEVAGSRYPLAVGYVGPCYLGWETRGIEVSPGDLVIMDLRVYESPDTLQQIVDLAGVYSGVHGDTTTQARVAVYDVDTGKDLLSFSVREVPDGHYLNRFNPDAMSDYEYTAQLIHVNLSTLSFVIRAEYNALTKGTNYYSFTTADVAGQGVQRWTEMEVATRVIVYGKTVYEERHGNALGALSKLDAEIRTGYTRLAMDKTGHRRISNTRTPLWSALSLLNSVCYLMAKYLPTNAQPDPKYNANDPCASWTDYWGVTRTTTLSFVGEVAPAVKAELPGSLTGINSNYTTDYWNNYIVPTAWAIYETTQAMRSAGDALPNRNNNQTYRHAASVYQSVAVKNNTDLKSWSSTTINHSIENYPIGKEAYSCIWQLISNNDARFTLQTSWDGYYSLWVYDRYVSGLLPQITFHIATASQKPMVRTEKSLAHITASDSEYSKTNKPAASQFKFSNTGFISHILSATQLPLAELYGVAYNKPAATLRDPEVTVEDNGYVYSYTTAQDTKINDVTYEFTGNFFTYARDSVNPALAGSAYFINY